MGKFIYGELTRVDFEDRLLAHIRVVIGNKLRRGESFFFSWKEDASLGSGRNTVWVHPAVPIMFKFYGSREPILNRAWLDALMYTANSPSGLYAVPEPAASAAEPVQTG